MPMAAKRLVKKSIGAKQAIANEYCLFYERNLCACYLGKGRVQLRNPLL
jgi:hypothetical protein